MASLESHDGAASAFASTSRAGADEPGLGESAPSLSEPKGASLPSSANTGSSPKLAWSPSTNPLVKCVDNDGQLEKPAAQYVTVSSILSRNGAAFSPRASAENEWAGTRSRLGSEHRRPSNGSALEALGALFLHRDASGKVSDLSAVGGARRSKPQHAGTEDEQAARSNWGKTGDQEAAIGPLASKVGVDKPSKHNVGETIAQRRARTQAALHDGQEAIFRTVRTRASELTFEVSVLKQSDTSGGNNAFDGSEGLRAPRLTPENHGSPSPLLFASSFEEQRRPSRASRSGFSFIDPPDAPPTPTAIPGAWTAGGAQLEGALLLPPPLLDDQGSDAMSFNELLGIRRLREREAAQKRLDLLKLRNRPAHKIGILKAMSNFVKAARAADQAFKTQSRRRQLARRHHEHTVSSDVAGSPRRFLDGAKDGRDPVDVELRGDLLERDDLQLHQHRSDSSLQFDFGSQDRPSKPSIGPTLLSLPPSPWTPYGCWDSSIEQQQIFARLGMTPIQGPIGTPRLAPAHLGILSPHLASEPRFSPIVLSPRALGKMNPESFGLSDPSPFVLSPTLSSFSAAASEDPLCWRGKLSGDYTDQAKGDRVTPLSLMLRTRHEQSKIDSNARAQSSQMSDVGRGADQHAVATRPLLLWFFFGNLGLSSPRSLREGRDPVSDSLWTFSTHVWGFGLFILTQLFDLLLRIFEAMSTTAWFLKWLFLNLTGRTVFAQCISEAVSLVRQEWQAVGIEEREDEPMRQQQENGARQTREGKGRGKEIAKDGGLSRWQIAKGLFELFCLQDVTRERNLREGAGLEELEKRSCSCDREPYNCNNESDDDESSDDDLLVIKRSQDVLEFVKTPRIGPHQYFPNDSGQRASQTHRGRARSSEATSLYEVPSELRRLIKTLKWASRLSVSAYGLHVTLVDLPPTFTPSGDRFSRQTFAHLSRLEREDVLYADIQSLDADDYSPTFYLVRDIARRTIAVSVRGTQSLQDIIVDLDLVIDSMTIDIGKAGENSKGPFYCHAGVLRAAKALLSRDSRLFQTLSEALLENPDFELVLTGHSLGGAIASTLALLISEQDGDESMSCSSVWQTHARSGLPVGRRIRAITFAHPATMSSSLAELASRGNPPLVINLTLGHDLIPRCGHGQAREVRRVLGALRRVQRGKHRGFSFGRGGTTTGSTDRGMPKQNNESAPGQEKVHIVTSWWHWRSLRNKGERASTKDIERKHRIEEALWKLRRDVENELHNANQRRRSQASSANISEDATENDANPSDTPRSPGSAQTRNLDTAAPATNETTAERVGGKLLMPAGQSLWLYEGKLYSIRSPLSFFGMPELHPQMFAHHFPSAYEDAIESL